MWIPLYIFTNLFISFLCWISISLILFSSSSLSLSILLSCSLSWWYFRSSWFRRSSLSSRRALKRLTYLCNLIMYTFDISNFQTIWSDRIHSLKYKRSTTAGCKDKRIRKTEFVARTQFLYDGTALKSIKIKVYFTEKKN